MAKALGLQLADESKGLVAEQQAAGYLVLETGEVFSGVWLGGKPQAGEAVFNTSHSGYEEIATDPSYYGQILVMTAPMQGNYGIDRKVWESRHRWIRGFVCLEAQSSQRDRSWIQSLTDAGIPIIDGVDTRTVTLRLRDRGTPRAAVVAAKSAEEAKELAEPLIKNFLKTEPSDWAHQVSRKEIEVIKGIQESGPRVVVYDFGAKENIIRELALRSREVVIVPSRTTAKEVLSHSPDGVLLSNGPGDPEQVQSAVSAISELLGKKPIFGICMGHQLLCRALGAKTFKLKFGHRGSNHPVRDKLLRAVYVTSQNHGYAVDPKTIPSNVVITHSNLNDDTVEGIDCPQMNAFSVQFHPESHPGPREAERLFDLFFARMGYS